MKWSNETPKEEGFYWFVGYPWKANDERKELYLVSIRKISNGFMYVASGNFMDNKKGLWQKAILPDVPEGTTIR